MSHCSRQILALSRNDTPNTWPLYRLHSIFMYIRMKRVCAHARLHTSYVRPVHVWWPFILLPIQSSLVVSSPLFCFLPIRAGVLRAFPNYLHATSTTFSFTSLSLFLLLPPLFIDTADLAELVTSQFVIIFRAVYSLAVGCDASHLRHGSAKTKHRWA